MSFELSNFRVDEFVNCQYYKIGWKENFTNSQRSSVYPRCFPWASSYLYCEWRLTNEMKLKKIIIHSSMTWSLQVKRTDSSIIVLKIFHLKECLRSFGRIFLWNSSTQKTVCYETIPNSLQFRSPGMCPWTFTLVLVLFWQVVHPHSRSRTEWKHTHRARTTAPVLHSLSEICEGWSWSILCLIVFCVLWHYLPVIHSHFPGTAPISFIIRCWFSKGCASFVEMVWCARFLVECARYYSFSCF